MTLDRLDPHFSSLLAALELEPGKSLVITNSKSDHATSFYVWEINTQNVIYIEKSPTIRREAVYTFETSTLTIDGQEGKAGDVTFFTDKFRLALSHLKQNKALMYRN